jgi:ribosome biogenesis GTPase
VVGVESGVARVLTDQGEVRASYSGGMLARIACDRACVPAPGHWVVLRRWCDNRVTIEGTWMPPATAKVIPLHGARSQPASRP